MPPLRCWLLAAFALAPIAAAAAEVAVATLVEGAPRVLRGVTWYKLVAGARLEDGDILSLGERAQVVAELTTGTKWSLVGPGTLYVEAKPAKGAPSGDPHAITLTAGWLKLAPRAPGARVRTSAAEMTSSDGALVVHVVAATLDCFVESGTAQLAPLLPNGSAGPTQPAREGEFWSNRSGGRLAASPRPPKAFIDAMPRSYLDPLPTLAAQYKVKPTLAADGDVGFAEAEPWLSGRDRAVFEKRFVARLRDPAFRRAVEPQIARYPSWDRMLHPEKYEPKPAAAK